MFKFVSDMIRKRREAKLKTYLDEWSKKEPELFKEWQDREREYAKEYGLAMQYAMSDLGGSGAHFSKAKRLEEEARKAKRDLMSKGFDPDRYRD